MARMAARIIGMSGVMRQRGLGRVMNQVLVNDLTLFAIGFLVILFFAFAVPERTTVFEFAIVIGIKEFDHTQQFIAGDLAIVIGVGFGKEFVLVKAGQGDGVILLTGHKIALQALCFGL